LDLSRYALAAATTTSGCIGDKIETKLHQSEEKNLINYEKYEIVLNEKFTSISLIQESLQRDFVFILQEQW